MAESNNVNDVSYFEGVEKLLEIWFKKRQEGDLRNIPRQSLESLLKIVHCEVISFSRNDKVDAYVLSESSMFVSERRFILKTCGTTTPLQCLKPLLCLVEQHAGFCEIDELFYSRKNFKRPDLQKNPHRSFKQEVAYLDTLFTDGVGYCLGDPDGDCWYLYTLQGPRYITGNKYDKRNQCEGDQTLEILMTDLDPKVMNIFTKKHSASAPEATKESGIDKILPQMFVDDFLFEPCGYSMNGISKDGSYMTIHVTPEPDFSYVSFETNIPQVSYKDVIQQVLDIFHPGKFVLTLFTNKESVASESSGIVKDGNKYKNFGDLQCHEVQYCPLRNYDLSFAFYSKFPS
ncbi:S-adenosylmethionine decarboxylase [Rhodnius prolixus]|uniref:S-adenosylmethionine decarboxylase n=1 Tax=Rhodnius prolixus TaxID=13249 RepID=UPI003D18878F